MSAQKPVPTSASGEGGVAARSGILTLRGIMPVESLRPGERVITRRGARVLQAIEVVELRDAAVVRLAAGSLGHDRPELAMTLAPDQAVLLRDWRARALYDQPEAPVPAARLVDGQHVRQDRAEALRFYRLRFELPEVIYADGLELACFPVMAEA